MKHANTPREQTVSLVIDTTLEPSSEWFAAELHDSGTLSPDALVTSSRNELIGTRACAQALRAAKLVIDLDAADVVE
jgi:hypothetical protein